MGEGFESRQSAAGIGRCLRAVVLLAGTIRPSDLGRAIGRSLLDLPVETGRTVLALWQVRVEELAQTYGIQALPMRVVINRDAPDATAPPQSTHAVTGIERDNTEFRGTGGLLRDVALSYSPDDLILVGNGAQVLINSLVDLVSDLYHPDASVSIITHADGTPSGLFLVRCSVFSEVADIGFLDFKEQLLPRLANAGAAIRVCRREHATGYPVRTLDSYLAGLRALHRSMQGRPVAEGAFEEDWSPTFSIVENGAVVDPTANVHDSVVLAGARLEGGAAAVRCVVCPGAVMGAQQMLADRVVAGRPRPGRGSP
jgi:hypothetical protein